MLAEGLVKAALFCELCKGEWALVASLLDEVDSLLFLESYAEERAGLAPDDADDFDSSCPILLQVSTNIASGDFFTCKKIDKSLLLCKLI